MTPNYYRRSSSAGLYGSSANQGTEPDIRQELINTLDGCFPEVAKGETGLLRRMRRDSESSLIPCPCRSTLTGEPDKDRFCPVCFSEGYLWDESVINFYKTLEGADRQNTQLNYLSPPGLINVPLVVFYIRYNAAITKDDKVIQLVLDTEGDPVEPYQRRTIYRVEMVWEHRADNGRLEFYKVFAHLDNVKYINAPSYADLE